MAAKVVKRKNQTAYVPDAEVAEEYRGRSIAGVEDFTLLEKARLQGKNVLLSGDTGSGKTMVGQAYAADRGLLYYRLPCDVSVDPSALFGKMIPTEEAGKFTWQDGPVTQIVRQGGVLNISEINFMLPKIAASLYPLLDSNRYIPLIAHEGEIVRAHTCDEDCAPDGEACEKALLIVADMNPNYRGTVDLNAAFQNRFTYKVLWGYDSKVETELVNLPALREVVSHLRNMPSEVTTPVGTNMMMDFENVARDQDLGLDFAIMNFVSGFHVQERQAVEKIMELHRDSIAQELAFDYDADDTEVEDIEWEFEQGGDA